MDSRRDSLTNGAPIPTPAGWPNIRLAYHPIRDKFEDGRSASVGVATMTAGANYWLQRLGADKTYLTTGTAPPAIPVPTGWPNIKSTYDGSIAVKLANATQEGASRSAQIAAVDYWIARVQQDASCIPGPFVVYPYP
jgi:hypothetical protein